MRMWMVNPEIMCRQHLLGEHLELHMFYGALKKNKNLWGYIHNNLFEPESLFDRHDQLVDEIISRGYNHRSPLNWYNDIVQENLHKYNGNGIINVDKSLIELVRRCHECLSRYYQYR